MRVPLAALTLLLLAQQPAARTVTLALPHALREGETATLLVRVGPIPRGARITITTPTAHPLGTIAPYGIRAGRDAGTYTVPLPPEAIDGTRVRLLLSLEFRGEKRAPTEKEVKRLRVGVRVGKE